MKRGSRDSCFGPLNNDSALGNFPFCPTLKTALGTVLYDHAIVIQSATVAKAEIWPGQEGSEVFNHLLTEDVI